MKNLAWVMAAAMLPSIALSEAATDKYAALAAEAANKGYQRGLPNDGVTKSAKAYTIGGVLVHEYVLSIRDSATEKEISAWRASVRSELFPGTCKALKKDDFFQNRGFQVRYRYLNQTGKVLDDFHVNKAACSAYGL